MTDDFNDIRGQLGPEDEDIKKHLNDLTDTIKGKIRKRAQQKYEGMTLTQLKTEIQAVSGQRLLTATDLIVGVLASLQILGVDFDRESKIKELAEFEGILLKLLELKGVPEDPDVVIKDLVEATTENCDEFVAEHTKGEHVGCMFDEYTKKLQEDSEWADEIGGDDDGTE